MLTMILQNRIQKKYSGTILADFIYQIRNQTNDRSKVESFKVSHSVMFAKNYNTDESCKI